MSAGAAAVPMILLSTKCISSLQAELEQRTNSSTISFTYCAVQFQCFPAYRRCRVGQELACRWQQRMR